MLSFLTSKSSKSAKSSASTSSITRGPPVHTTGPFTVGRHASLPVEFLSESESDSNTSSDEEDNRVFTKPEDVFLCRDDDVDDRDLPPASRLARTRKVQLPKEGKVIWYCNNSLFHCLICFI